MGERENGGGRRFNTVEKVLLLQDLEIFRLVSTEHLAQLAALAREREFPAGSVLFREGDPCQELCLLVRGRVRLEGNSGCGEAEEQAALDFLSFLAERPHSMTATAADECTLLTVPYEDLVEYLSGEAEFCWAVLRYVSSLARSRCSGDPLPVEIADDATLDQTLV